jgi:hypothetical protein
MAGEIMIANIIILIAAMLFVGCSSDMKSEKAPENTGRFKKEYFSMGSMGIGGCYLITDTQTGEEYLNCKSGYGESIVHLEKRK